MKFLQANGSKLTIPTLGLLLAVLFSNTSALAATAPTPSPSPSPVATPTASELPKVSPVYSNTNVPLIRSITTSTEKIEGQFNLRLKMVVRINRNTLNSAAVVFSPKTLDRKAVDPIFMPPCAKLNNISLATLTPSGDLTSLQTRVIDGDWFLETHVFTSATKLPAGQDICPGQYVITAINIVDSAKKTLNISANLASTFTTATGTGKAPTTGTTSSKVTYNDIPAQTSNIWTNYLELAPCPQAVNVNPIVTVVPGKTTIVNGRSQTTPPTTKTEIPSTPAALRTTCNHTADFAKIYLSVVINTAGGGTGETKNSGSTLLPVVDYASQTKVALDENQTMKKQLEVLTKQVDGMKRTIEIYKTGGIPSEDGTNTGATAVDYKAKAKALQAKVNALTKQIKALKGSKAASKPATKIAVPTKRPTMTSRPTPSQSSSRSGGSGGWRANSNSNATPKPNN
jgi:hypothetical protein